MGKPGLTDPRGAIAGADSTYDAALAYLFARTGGSWSLGLDRMRALLESLGNPEQRLRTLHVAGTNGKGSVVATLEALLGERGLSIARYTSPHLVDYRERLLIDGRPVESIAVTDWVERWTPTVERLGATFFEATTAMAFDLFARAEVDIAAIETGLGGRLDATNVLTPLVASVTSVGLDHIEYLGSTLESIAREKAGIFKRGIPAVIGELDPAIRRILVDEARGAGASESRVAAEECRLLDIRVSGTGTWSRVQLGAELLELETPLIGRHQAQNLATALLTLDAVHMLPPRDRIRDLLANVRLPGRFQRVGPFIFDVAHNPAGAEVLARTVEDARIPQPLVVLLTVLADKDWRGMMHALAPVTEHFVITHSPTAPASRAWHPEEALAFASGRGWSASLETDFDRALAEAQQRGASVLVTGSFHTVGDAMARLQVDPLAA